MTKRTNWVERDLLPKRFVVYRLYGKTRQLLYVGCTREANLKNRLMHHDATHPWFSKVVACETEVFDNEQEASEREQMLIRESEPRHNKRTTRYVRGTAKRSSGQGVTDEQRILLDEIALLSQESKKAAWRYREAIDRGCKAGLSYTNIGAALGMNKATVYRLRQTFLTGRYDDGKVET